MRRTSAARRRQSHCRSLQVTPPRTVSRACFIRPPDNWTKPPRLSNVPWRPTRRMAPPMASPDTMQPFSGAPARLFLPLNGRWTSTGSERRHSIWFFFGGFAELLLQRTETAIPLFHKSLERNPSYGSAQLFLAAALSATGRHKEAADTAAKFRALYPQHRTRAFEQLWLSRSISAAYRAQIHPAFEKIRGLGLAN